MSTQRSFDELLQARLSIMQEIPPGFLKQDAPSCGIITMNGIPRRTNKNGNDKNVHVTILTIITTFTMLNNE